MFMNQINYNHAKDSQKPVYQTPMLGEKRSQSGQGISILNQNAKCSIPIKEVIVAKTAQKPEVEQTRPNKFTHVRNE